MEIFILEILTAISIMRSLTSTVMNMLTVKYLLEDYIMTLVMVWNHPSFLFLCCLSLLMTPHAQENSGIILKSMEK
jgi:hypothetical protein